MSIPTELEYSKPAPKKSKSLSNLPKPDKVLAICCSDLHIWGKAPIARSAEPNWFEAMKRNLSQLNDLWIDNNCPPIICAGDIFDKWNPSPEVVNFAIEHLPRMYAIPGQHDLPHHNLSDIKKTGFWTLVEAGKLTYIHPESPIGIGSLELHGFPWGTELQPFEGNNVPTTIAVVHKYVWKEGRCYPNPPEENKVNKLQKQLKGYDFAVFGDNHQGFVQDDIINCGGFFRRKMDEKKYCPMVVLIKVDRTIEERYLDCSKDKFLDVEKIAGMIEEIGSTTFVEELLALGDSALDFSEAIQQLMERKKVPSEIKKIIMEALR